MDSLKNELGDLFQKKEEKELEIDVIVETSLLLNKYKIN